jgi:hypothetical protein
MRDCSSTAERAVKNELTGRMRIAILDDYQNVATRFADWDSLDADVVVFTKPFSGADDVVRSLAGFDVLVAMRERTHFPAEVLEKLTDVRLLASTGSANAAIDVAAAGRLDAHRRLAGHGRHGLARQDSRRARQRIAHHIPGTALISPRHHR